MKKAPPAVGTGRGAFLRLGTGWLNPKNVVNISRTWGRRVKRVYLFPRGWREEAGRQQYRGLLSLPKEPEYMGAEWWLIFCPLK